MRRLADIAARHALSAVKRWLKSPAGSRVFVAVRNARLPWTPGDFDARIVTLNMGLGRDSLAMLCLLAEGKLVAENKPVTRVDAVVFADTGAEWRHTTALIPRVRAFCDEHSITFVVLQKPPASGPGGYRAYLDALPAPGDPHRQDALKARPWRGETGIEARARTGYYHLRPPIMEDYRSRGTIASRSKKDCTSNNKVEPIRKLIEDLSVEKFGADNVEWGAAVRAGRHAPHLSLLGIAADEPTRAMVGHPAEGGSGPWYVTEAYPLLEMGITKADEAAILARHGFDDVRKSGCAMCPFQPIGWFWALRESEPERWAEVVAYENEALARNARMFLTGKMPINDAVDRWRAEHPDATVDAVLSKTYERDEGCQAAKHNPAARCPDCAAAFDAWETFAPAARRNPRPEFVVRSPAAGHRLIAGPVYTANWQAAQRVKPRERMAVLLPCAGTKPFSEAPSHKHGYLPALEGLAVDRYVVAEPLGIVPWDWEQKWPNDAYDFPPVYLRGEGRALLAERVRAWFETGPGRHYSRIYLALPGHHGRLVADATAGLTLPLVDLSITACRDAGDCGPGVHRATATDYRDYLHAAVARRNPAAQVAEDRARAHLHDPGSGLAGTLDAAARRVSQDRGASMSSIQTDRKAASDRFFDALEAIAGERQVIYFSPFVLVGDRRGGILGQLEIRVQTGIGPHDEIGVHLAFIGVPKAERRLGRGSRLMEIIVGAADAAGLPVDLNVDPTPSADDGRKAPVSKRDLRAWYGRFGFVPVRALGVDYLYRPARRSNPRTLGDVARRAGLHALSAWFAAPGVSEATRAALRPSFARVGACDTPNDCTTRGVIDPPRIEGAADRSESDRPPPFWTPRETPPDSPERAATQLKEIIDAYRDPRLRPPDFGPMKRRLRAIAKSVDLADAASYDRLAVLSQWLDYEAPMEVLAERERDERAQMITDILAWTHPDFGDRKARTILRYDPTRGTTLVPLDTATTEELRAWHIEKAPKTVEFPTRGGRLDGFLRIDLWESAEAGLPHGLAYGDEEYAPEDATEEEREAAGFPNEGPRQAEESEETRGDRRLVELMREGWHPDHGFLRWPRNVADLTLLHERVVDAMNALDEQIEHRVGEGSHPEGRAHAKASLQAGQRFDKLVLAELAKVEQAPRTNPASGDCYQAAANYVQRHADDDLVLVHGTVGGTGKLAGKRFGHAWVIDGNTVIDQSNGHDLRVSKAAYYAVGRVGKTVSYTPTEVLVNLLRHKHYGPWPKATRKGGR